MSELPRLTSRAEPAQPELPAAPPPAEKAQLEPVHCWPAPPPRAPPPPPPPVPRALPGVGAVIRAHTAAAAGGGEASGGAVGRARGGAAGAVEAVAVRDEPGDERAARVAAGPAVDAGVGHRAVAATAAPAARGEQDDPGRRVRDLRGAAATAAGAAQVVGHAERAAAVVAILRSARTAGAVRARAGASAGDRSALADGVAAVATGPARLDGQVVPRVDRDALADAAP